MAQDLAFCLYGNFNWPPNPENTNRGKTVPGYVLIRFIKDKDHFKTWLGWVPKDEKPPKGENEVKPFPTPRAGDRNICDPGEGKQAWDLFDKDVRSGVWLNKDPDGHYKKDMLRFSGAFLLEAYDLTSEEATSPRLRWPLIDAFTHLMSEGSTSGLTIGLEDGSEGFTLDLAIPTPVAQTAKEGFSNTSVFPFRVAFPVQGNTNQHQPDHALKVWFGAWGSASDEAHLPSQNRQLGEFGFSCLGDQVIETDLHDRSEHEEFAHLHQEKILTDKPRRKGKKHKHPDTDPNIHYTNSAINWWPVNKIKDYSDISETLKSFGLTTDSTPRCDFLTGFLTGESDSVITPPSELCIDLRIKNNSPNTITYRYTQYAKKGANFSHPTSDIAVRSGKLSLRMKNELDGWIDLDSDKITFQFSLSCPVPSNNPQDRFAINKKAKRANLNPSLYTTLLWDQDIPIDLGKSTRLSQIADERHYRFGTLEDAFRSSRTGRQALERIESNQPQSFLPELETRVSTANEKVRFELVPLEKIDASFCDKNGHLNWSVTTEPTDPRYYLTLPEAADVLTPSQLTYIPINACFPGINSKIIEDSAFLPLKLVHDKPDKESGFATFKIENDSDPTDHSHDFKGRLGSLLFSGKSPLLLQGDETNYSRLTTVPYHSILTNFLSVTRTEEPIGLHLQWNLAINSVHPVTADIPRSSRQNNVPPLVINTSGSDPNGQFILKVEEWIGTGDDWRLIANLSETELEGGPASRSYVVISQEPFGLTRFTRKSLERLGGLESSSVANYHSNRRSWQFKKSVATYRYSLAPQVIGDGTDKPRRHEIHDLPEGDELSDLPPYPTDSNGNDINPIGTYLVDFRLPPSAELWVRPSDLERNYTLPEWSSYEVFRQRNDFGLGASLAGFRGEFLYGLSVGIDTGRKNEPSFGVRVAEIEAITGHVAQRTFTTRPYKTLDTRWDHLKVALKRRPERLEFWVQNSRNSQPFQPARFEEGVSFALRETALHKPAILPPNEGPESTQHFSMPVQTSDGGPRYHNAGLPGGALWPLESWSFFDKLMKNPTSSGGSIEDIALSPTGGDADQSALFLEGNVKIISETRGGLVQKQRVEISGRIGVFWHRAKHVVVYERTVNASAQFAPKERADTRTRRPVLRKVSEFIELLEPVRRYPDTGHATARSAGFLDSVRFNSKTISVDSAWGEDVEEVINPKSPAGWQIPLWNRYSARIRPQVYPRPDISFVTIAEGEGERPLIAQECLNPENVYFYAESTKESNTDAWLPRLGLDAANMLSPDSLLKFQNDLDKPDKSKLGDGAKRKVNASRVLPGYRRFTWRLAPSGQRSLLNAERGDKPIFASLESITFMRAANPLPDEKTEKTIKNIIAMGDALSGPDTRIGYWGPDGQGGPNISDGSDGAQRFGALLGELKKAIDSKDEKQGKAIFALLKTAVGGGNKQQFRNIVNKIYEKSTPAVALTKAKKQFSEFKGDYGKLTKLLDKEASLCSKFADEVVVGIQHKARLISEEVRSTVDRANSMMEEAEGDRENIKTKDKFIDYITDEIMLGVGQILDGPRADIGDLQGGLETARAIVQDIEVDIEKAIIQGLQRVDSASTAYDRTKPWSDSRLKEFSLKLQSEVDGIYGDINSALSEARQRLASEMSETSQAFSAIAASILTQVVKARTSGLHALNEGELQIQLSAEQALGALNTFYNDDLNTGIYFQIKGQIDKIPSKEKKKYKVPIENMQNLLKAMQVKTTAAKNKLIKSIKIAEQTGLSLEIILKATSTDVKSIVTETLGISNQLETLIGAIKDEPLEEIRRELKTIKDNTGGWVRELNRFASNVDAKISDIGEIADWTVDQARQRINEAATEARDISNDAFVMLEDALGQWSDDINVIKNAFGAGPEGGIPTLIKINAVKPAVETILKPLSEDVFVNINKNRKEILSELDKLAKEIEVDIKKLKTGTLKVTKASKKACESLSNTLYDVRNELEKAAADFVTVYKDKFIEAFKTKDFGNIEEAVGKWTENIDELKHLDSLVKDFDHKMRGAYNEAGRTIENVRNFGDRLLDRAANLGSGGLAAAPNRALALYSAATSSPEIALLQSNIDRLRTTFRDVDDIIHSTKANALFAQLGDALKSIGLELPFDKIGDQFQIDDSVLKDLDLSKVFRNFGGLKLDNLLEGVKLPSGDLNNHIHLSHDFDTKQGRAWVRLAVNLPLPGRKVLFQLGPFAAYFRDTSLTGFVSLEANKDSERLNETGEAVIRTAIVIEISGQQIVTLENVAIRHTQKGGLDFEFDPKNIKLNSVFQFVQDTLGSLFPGEFGGLTIIKDRGIPVGVEHEFTMPPMSANFGTSGFTNLAISNRFKLLAYPDFMLSDRFNLSRPEQPFIFSIFIIGGTGYIQCDTEYRPSDKTLSVIVEAAAGGSAALAFAFGPVSGGVYITLSVALSYRKVIGGSSGGLSVSLVLTIGGNLSLWGMVHVFLVIVLRMTYQSNGQIDAFGSLKVEVRVCRWVKLKYRTSVVYKLRDGQSSTQITRSIKVEPGPDLAKLRDKANKLKGVRV